jgi:hypothetical protein
LATFGRFTCDKRREFDIFLDGKAHVAFSQEFREVHAMRQKEKEKKEKEKKDAESKAKSAKRRNKKAK